MQCEKITCWKIPKKILRHHSGKFQDTYPVISDKNR
jgi:hypothetical protein